MKAKNNKLAQQGSTLQALANLLQKTMRNLVSVEGPVCKALSEELFEKFLKDDESELSAENAQDILARAFIHHKQKLTQLQKKCSLDGALYELKSAFLPSEDIEPLLMEIERDILVFLSKPYDGLLGVDSRYLNDVVENSRTQLTMCFGMLRQYHFLRDSHCEGISRFLKLNTPFSTAFNNRKNKQKNTEAYIDQFFEICDRFIEHPENIASFFCDLLTYQQEHNPNADGSPRLYPASVKEKYFFELTKFINLTKEKYIQHAMTLKNLMPKRVTLCGRIATLNHKLEPLKSSEKKDDLKERLREISVQAKKNKYYLYNPAVKVEELELLFKKYISLEFKIEVLKLQQQKAELALSRSH